MAFRLNHLFQTAPPQFLERTVLFMNGINPDQVRNKLTHFIDFEPSGKHARARVLNGLHEYQQDAPLASYFFQPNGVLSVSHKDPGHRFIFVSELTRCRLLISPDGDKNFRLHMEENLVGKVPPPDSSRYTDSLAYWDFITRDLVGEVRSTVVLHKQPGEPWMITMQQIVGIPGSELVHKIISRPLKLGY